MSTGCELGDSLPIPRRRSRQDRGIDDSGPAGSGQRRAALVEGVDDRECRVGFAQVGAGSPGARPGVTGAYVRGMSLSDVRTKGA